MSDLDNEEYETFGFGKAGGTEQTSAADSRRGEPGRAGVTSLAAAGTGTQVDLDLDLDDDDEDDDDDDDELEDASEDEIDFVIAAYREDGQSLVQALNKDFANDLEELVVQLRRLPGDAGAIGYVSLVEEVFVIVRVRGRRVQVLLSDGTASADWPIARDVADLLGADIPDSDEEGDPMGDLALLADLGLSEFDLGGILDDLDLGSDQMLFRVADRLNIGREFRRVAEAAFRS